MTSYRLTGRVETGELSELYAGVRDEHEPVVLKLFHAKTSDVRYAQELAETARLLGSVRAPGIVRYLDIGLLKERLAVVRQAVEGITLGQVLTRLTSKEVVLPPPLSMWVVIQVLETVQLAHDAGAVHGALTPGNILLDADGQPAICDFGALKALQAVPALRKSFGGRGRDAYRAPEVAKGDEPSIESDIYSLGAITYELLTLREPLGDRSGTLSTRSGILPPPSRLDRRLNSRLDPIVMRALELSEGRRFRSAGEFATALRNFLANNGGIPPAEDLRRFLEPLRPREGTQSLGPVPVADAFVLREVRGADLPPVTERTQVVELRPSFSGPRPFDLPLSTDPAAETMQASPAFEEYKEVVRSSGVTDPGDRPRPSGLKAAPRGMAEPKFEEDTSPSHAGPLEGGWEAPAGAPPPKPRVGRGGEVSLVTGRPVARNPRVKFIEDFSSPPTEAAAGVMQEERTAQANLEELQPRPAPKASGPKGMLPPPPRNLKVMEITGPLDYAALPPDTHQGLPRPLNTAERFLADDAKRRKRMLLVALALAFVGAFSFALAIRRFGSGGGKVERSADRGPGQGSGSAEPYDPAYQTVNGALKKYFRAEEQQGTGNKEPPPLPQRPVPAFAPPVPTLTPPQQEAEADDSHFHRPPPRERAAFLSLSSDVSAIVYIDDRRVKRRTPLVRYPVHPGLRKVVLEAVETGDRRNFELNFEKGQTRKVEQKFKTTRLRR